MNNYDLTSIPSEYLSWLKQNIESEKKDHNLWITTPFLDRHNDHIQIYAYEKDGKITITDDGYILSDLKANGIDLETRKRKIILEDTLNGFGVKHDNGEIFIEATEGNVGKKVHTLLQSIISVNDLFVLARPYVESLFWEDVQTFFESENIRYIERAKLTGASGLDHNIDFLIPKSKKSPERMVKAINNPVKNTVTNYLFSVNDVKNARSNRIDSYAIINDTEKTMPTELISAMREYNVVPIMWSNKEQGIEALAS